MQSLVDQGKLAPDEAASHTERALLVRALGAGVGQVEADLALRTALVGDRYLLCSDGLSAVVDRGALHAALSVPAEPEQVAGQLIDLAYAHGAPDNIASSSPTPSRRRPGGDRGTYPSVDSSDSDSIRRRVSESRVHHG